MTELRRHPRQVRHAVAAPLLGSGLDGPASAAEALYRLTGPQIQARVAGKEITDAVHWAYVFEPQGQLRAVSMGRARRGTWRVERDELCLDATPCVQVWMTGTRVELRRDGALPEEGVLQAPHRRP